MNIISITPEYRTLTTGRFSDGSDREEKTFTNYTVVLQNSGSKFERIFEGTEPTTAEIEQAYEDGLFAIIEPTQDEIQTQTLLNTEYLVVMTELENL